jgi:hypothetical protein
MTRPSAAATKDFPCVESNVEPGDPAFNPRRRACLDARVPLSSLSHDSKSTRAPPFATDDSYSIAPAGIKMLTPSTLSDHNHYSANGG